MFAKILGIAAVSAVLATGALAQTNNPPTSTAPDQGTAANNAEMLKKWKGPIGAAFFTDDTMATLRSEADMKTAWATLTPDQQAQVKADCSATASTTPPKSTAPDATAPDKDGNLSHVETICGFVDSM